MLTVEIRSFSSRRFDPGTGKHPTPFGFRCLPLLDGAGECKKCVFGGITAKTDLSTAKEKNFEVLPIMEDALTLSSALEQIIKQYKGIKYLSYRLTETDKVFLYYLSVIYCKIEHLML